MGDERDFGKVVDPGGDVVAHSSVPASQGFRRRERLDQALHHVPQEQRKNSRRKGFRPPQARRFKSVQPRSG